MSTASDLVALQLVLQYWTDHFPGWALSLIFWAVLIGVNIVTVAAYGELEYWLSLLKVVTIIVSPTSVRGRPYYVWGAHTAPQVFIIVGIAVNCGGNTTHHYIGGENWRLPDAPFIGGIGGFASVFVTASFACEFRLGLVCNRRAMSSALTALRRWHRVHCHYRG